ncbi:MAG: TIGR00266 family protein [Myxococcales bacterium]|nr:TIGR00266 family protein [Myxococcales bacterium]MCB9523496.1 TIGR00266 family protein [Myxococcales bacterium]
MLIDIQYRPAHTLAIVQLAHGETVTAESGAMVSMDRHIQVRTDGPMSKKRGGFLKGLGRAVLGGETFFTNDFTAQGAPGQVTFAPTLTGDMVVHELDGHEDLFIQGSSFVASATSVQLDTKWQGFVKGFLSGESMFFLRAHGTGPVIMNAFGAVDTVDLDGELIVDTGHLVAFTSGIQYEISRAAPGLIASFLSGEGFVLKVRGRGRLYLQTRNPTEYGKTVGPKLPPRQE